MICERSTKEDIRKYGKNPARQLVYDGRFIEVVSTPCHLGGVRWWFLCPGCNRRCAILYPRLCRLCRNLSYQSEHLSPADRLIKKAINIRTGLGQTSGGVLVPFPLKPKYMRWHTYLRIRAEATEIERRIAVNLIQKSRRLYGDVICSP
jgi:hypothetical protein